MKLDMSIRGQLLRSRTLFGCTATPTVRPLQSLRRDERRSSLVFESLDWLVDDRRMEGNGLFFPGNAWRVCFVRHGVTEVLRGMSGTVSASTQPKKSRIDGGSTATHGVELPVRQPSRQHTNDPSCDHIRRVVPVVHGSGDTDENSTAQGSEQNPRFPSMSTAV